MAAMLFSVLFLAMSGVSDATWCVCKTDASNGALQKTIDYACGAGADCSPILQNGACYNPNTVFAHCSYAANSYFQRKGQAQGSCDFTGTAIPTQTDPSANGCSYPATPSAASSTNGSGGGAGTATQNPGSSSSTGGFTPTQSGTGVLGGLGPSGTTTSIDGSGAASSLLPTQALSCCSLLLAGLLWLRP